MRPDMTEQPRTGAPDRSLDPLPPNSIHGCQRGGGATGSIGTKSTSATKTGGAPAPASSAATQAPAKVVEERIVTPASMLSRLARRQVSRLDGGNQSNNSRL
jgi:hypothetical protein